MIFILRTRPHPSFERSGNDLLTKVHITLSEALTGFSRILLTHLDGRGIRVTSPKGKIIKSGDSIILRDEGMPLLKSPDQKGCLYVVFEVDFPEEDWLKTIDVEVRRPRLRSTRRGSLFACQALAALLPPKKPEIDPKPAVIDEVPFEESDIADVRETPFAGGNFFDHGFSTQFGEDEEDWEDDDDSEGGEPECRNQ